MLKNISFRCEYGMIKLFWEWESDDVDMVNILYKRSEIPGDGGSEFIKGGVIKYPHSPTGKAERKIVNECGLFDFTFVPRLKDGSYGEKISISNIMLGDAVNIYWSIETQRDGTVMTFPDCKVKIPDGVAYIEYSDIVYDLNYEITKASKLLFPLGLPSDNKVQVKAREPYDKVYKFLRK